MRRRASWWETAAVVAVGVTLAHAADFIAVFPDTETRSRALEATGHGDWPLITTLAVIAAMAAAVGAVRSGLGARRRHRRPAPTRLSVGLTTAGWQAGAFALLEVVERLSAGRPPWSVLHEPVFWLGLLLQLPVAAAVLAVRALVEAVSARISPSPIPWDVPWPAALVAAGAPAQFWAIAPRTPVRPRAPPPAVAH